MTQIRDFRALVYNPAKVSRFSSVVCPPYDIINPSQREYFAQLSLHNMVHIILPESQPEDGTGAGRYQRAAHYLSQWIKEGILVYEKEPSFYFYEQYYKIQGEMRQRLGFFGLLSIGDTCQVYPHEQTKSEPKQDRLQLLRRVEANLSPIFVLFEDDRRLLQRTYEARRTQPAFIGFKDEEGNAHHIWRISEPRLKEGLKEYMQDKSIFIADGHHRFEVSCLYRTERMAQAGEEEPLAGYNYLLTYFTDFDERGLTILPTHRLIKEVPENNLRNLQARFSEYFAVEIIDEAHTLFYWMKKAARNEHAFGMYLDGKFWLLRLKSDKKPDKIIQCPGPQEYKDLDISILNYIILDKFLGVDPMGKEVCFTQSEGEAITKVKEKEMRLALFTNAVKMEQVKSLASLGVRMPPKSTYFFPKLLSGLLIHKFSMHSERT